MLAMESALLLLLRRKVRDPLPSGIVFAHQTLIAKLSRVYLAGRLAARVAGVHRLVAETETFDPDLAEQLNVRERTEFGVATLGLIDLRRSTAAAQGYAKRWLSNLRDAQEAGVKDPFRSARLGSDASLQTGAITENSHAFNSGRQQATREIAPLLRRLELDMARVWNAVLDKRTCTHCTRMDGNWVLAGEQFPGGEPGAVHPRCRCHDELVPRAWVDSLDRAA